jgi:hypothetical protein
MKDIDDEVKKLISYSEIELRKGLNIYYHGKKEPSKPLTKTDIEKIKSLRKQVNFHAKRCVDGQKKWRGKYYPNKPRDK